MDELMRDHDTPLIPLSDATLNSLPDHILRPRYDRSKITPGIVHIGLGNFHRAHQSWYVHRLMQQGKAMDWGILGAGVMPGDAVQRDRLAAQDYLTTLIELDPAGTSAEVVGSMIGFVPVEERHGALIKALSDPAIRIVSLTVTEGGYFLDPATKTFDANHPDIVHDAGSLTRPRTAFGAIVAALQARRAAGLLPFTCQSCDNLPGNGAILRDVVCGLAKLADTELAAWIEAEVRFPNSMVDCIVPATGPGELELARRLGLDDAAPVTHENFRQWVLEDSFCAGRPPLEDVGATLSSRVHDYEAMKLRILNGGHQMIAAPAEIIGLGTIAETMQHPLIGAYLRKVILTEVAPHVPDVPGKTPQDYLDLIADRFSNPEIRDTVRRVAFDGASRHTGSVLPVIRDALARGAPVDGLALTQALWARMCRGTREDGSEIAPNDPIWPQLTQAALRAQNAPEAWLAQSDIYGDIGHDTRFADSFARWLGALYADGVETTLRRYLGDGDIHT